MSLYKRFIDVILIVWKGDQEVLREFIIKHIGGNKYGIKFTVNAHEQTINFLDLEIFKNGGYLNTRRHFKDTDRNG